MISEKTFLTFFLKADEDAAAIKCELDASDTLCAEDRAGAACHQAFCGHGAARPRDGPVQRIHAGAAPRFGIEFVEIPRLCDGGGAISASRVRTLWRDPETAARALGLVPPSTHSCLARRLPGRTRTE